MALDAVVGALEGILAVVAGAAGLALVHVSHGGLECAGLVGEDLGVAVGTLVHAEMEVVAEVCLAGIGLEQDVGRLVAFVALVALTLDGEGIRAVVAAAAGFPFFHLGHGCLGCAGLVGEYLGVAVWALEHADMDLVAEDRVGGSLGFEGNFAGFHPLVAVAAIAGHGEGFLAVVAGAAGFALFHLRHGHVIVFAGDDFAVVAASAGNFPLCQVSVVAEGHLGCALHFKGNIAGFALVAFGAELFVLDAECLDAGVAGTAGLGLFHFGHGVTLLAFQVEDGVVANLAVLVVLFQVDVVAEDDRFGVLECKLDILGLFRRNRKGEGDDESNCCKETKQVHI